MLWKLLTIVLQRIIILNAIKPPRMSKSRLPVVLLVFLCSSAYSQIFINTGNPNLNKYKEENPNAVIWQGGSEVPSNAGTSKPSEEPKKQAEPKKEIKKTEPVTETKPAAPVAVGAGEGPADGPPNAEPGKCYARCVVPDEYEFKEEQVIDKPASVKIEKIPARYETVYDTIIVTPATKKTITTPAQYEVVTEQVLVTPATQKWVKGKASVTCLSQDPKDCEVWCLKEIPAVYKTETHKVEKVAAVTTEKEIPAVTKVVPRKKMVEPARENKVEVPATYKTVMKKVLVKKGGYQGWKEVLCEQNATDNKIGEIQKALKREGYDPGPIDNQMGGKTKEALIKFQQDKGLPVGNLNTETLKALGVE